MRLYRHLFACFCLIASLALVLCLRVHAQSSPAASADAGYQPRVDQFWKLLEAGRTDAALDIAKPDDTTSEDYAAFRKQYEDIATTLGGRCSGHFKFNETSYGDHITTVFYVAYYEKLPLVLDLTFYNFDGKWKIVDINMKARSGYFRDITKTRMGIIEDTTNTQTPAGALQN